MSHDPYSVPNSPMNQPARKPAPIKAVIYGLLVDTGGSILFGMLFAIAYGAMLSYDGMAPADVTARLTDMDLRTPVGFLVSVVGLLFSFLGGYVCARVAVERVYACASVMLVIEIIMTLFTVDDDALMALLMTILMAAAVFLGVYVQQKKLHGGRS